MRGCVATFARGCGWLQLSNGSCVPITAEHPCAPSTVYLGRRCLALPTIRTGVEAHELFVEVRKTRLHSATELAVAIEHTGGLDVAWRLHCGNTMEEGNLHPWLRCGTAPNGTLRQGNRMVVLLAINATAQHDYSVQVARRPSHWGSAV